jgi:hypothetical protein
MKHKLLISAALAVVSFKCHALNPLVQTIYTADMTRTAQRSMS